MARNGATPLRTRFARGHRGEKAADRRPKYLHTEDVWSLERRSEAATGHSAGQTADGCGQGVIRLRAATAALQTKPSLGACVFMTPESRVTAAPAASRGSHAATQQAVWIRSTALRHVSANPRRSGQDSKTRVTVAATTLVRPRSSCLSLSLPPPFVGYFYLLLGGIYSGWD